MKSCAVVVGSADAVAVAIAERLLDDGWPVALLGEEGMSLGEAEEMLEGEDAMVLAVDRADEDELAEVFDQVVDALGPIGALVFRADAIEPHGAAESASGLQTMLERHVVFATRVFQCARERMAGELAVVAVNAQGQNATAVTDAALAALVGSWSRLPSQRANRLTFARPSDLIRISSVVAFLASAESAGLAGQSLHVSADPSGE